MKATEAIQFTIESSTHVVDSLLADLTDQEFLHRPAPGANHINWQLGHLIAAEHMIVAKDLPGAMPPLPEGFAAKYGKETDKVDDPKKLCTKAELLQIMQEQRAGTLAALAKTSETELDRKCEGWTPTLAAVFLGAAATHWLMHVGQWSVVRRQLGRKPLF